MKIMLINPVMPVYLRTPSLPLGPVSIASYLKANGHEVSFIERSVKKYDMKKEISSFSPDVIGISAMSFLSSMDAKKVTSELRGLTKAPIIWGGQAASASPELILREAKPDYIMLGEGEITWLEVADTLASGGDLTKIDGLAFFRDGRFISNPVRRAADISVFPEMDWSFVDAGKYFSSFFNCTKMFYLHASKGCPGACTFCSNKEFHQGRNRCRAPEHVLNDIDYFVKNYGANGIYFSDELFCPQRALREQLCRGLIERNYDLVWGCQMRLGVLNEEDIKLMYEAGCRWILFGIESGNQPRIDSIKKHTDISLAKQNVEWCEKAGITVQASFIIGFPDETPEEMTSTLRFAETLPASLTVMNILTPIPNSEIFNYIRDERPDMKLPDTIKGLARTIEQDILDKVPYNLSKIPELDLRVVHHFYQWKDFSGKKSVNDDSYGVIKKLARDTVNRIFMHGLKGFVFGTYVSVKQFITVFFYSHFYPSVLKKYGLK